MDESVSSQSLHKLSRLSSAINNGTMSPSLTKKYVHLVQLPCFNAHSDCNRLIVFPRSIQICSSDQLATHLRLFTFGQSLFRNGE
jgi:hypothetical protein